MKGSGDVSSQCCGSAELELGTVYAAEEIHVQFLGIPFDQILEHTGNQDLENM